MKKVLLSTAVALVGIATVAGSASAADLAARPYTKAPPIVEPIFTWTGWYIGVNGGGSFGGSSTGKLAAFSTAPAGNDFTPAVAAGGTPRALGVKHNGGFGGGQIGYNWQTGPWVWGLETDIQGASIGSASTVVFPGGGGIVPSVSTGRDRIDWFGTFRGRVGYAADRVLFYATGGLAYGEAKSSISNIYTPNTAGVFVGSKSDTRVGWAAGAGIEWAFLPGWSLKGEYLHVDLGRTSVNATDPINFPGGAFATYRFKHDFDSARVGINYHFNSLGPILAKY
ncbi:outer membrane protein [Bradyrhizobium sp. 2TAF24]|uniref:outer membrane protein n=1 Tax=Bradyrhizobium sp. 2TAF24 TaxID=3233011 RepID=UPI003F93478A